MLEPNKLINETLDSFSKEMPHYHKKIFEKYESLNWPTYQSLYKINKSQGLIEFVQEKISKHINKSFNIHKHLYHHSESTLFYESKDFGFEISTQLTDYGFKVRENRKRDFENYDSIFNGSIYYDKLSKLITNKISNDKEAILEWIKKSWEAEILRFFILGRIESEWIYLDNLLHKGIKEFEKYFTEHYKKANIKSEINVFSLGGYGFPTKSGSFYHNEKATKWKDKICDKLKSKDNVTFSEYIEMYYGNPYNVNIYGFKEVITFPFFNGHQIPVLEIKANSDFANCWHTNAKHLCYSINKFREINFRVADYIPEIEKLHDYLKTNHFTENYFRKEFNLPLVGEGWISETNLYYSVKNHYSKYIVLQHAKPKWLGNQHFDIFLPELNLAIEYQGKQHYEPVEFFGGKEAFERNKARDLKKFKVAETNNCKIIYVDEGYELNDILEKIDDFIVQNRKNS